jgi:hypothetical protein
MPQMEDATGEKKREKRNMFFLQANQISARPDQPSSGYFNPQHLTKLSYFLFLYVVNVEIKSVKYSTF